jgi:hypothetical protein
MGVISLNGFEVEIKQLLRSVHACPERGTALCFAVSSCVTRLKVGFSNQ